MQARSCGQTCGVHDERSIIFFLLLLQPRRRSKTIPKLDDTKICKILTNVDAAVNYGLCDFVRRAAMASPYLM